MVISHDCQTKPSDIKDFGLHYVEERLMRNEGPMIKYGLVITC